MNKQIYYRLIALWAVCEGLIGGIVHGFKLPVSGLVVGSCAVVCISLIARYNPNRGSILKATILVAIFKMMLSPQSPPMAYVAVFFQGLLGELLYIRRKNFVLGTYFLAILSLLESAFQRLLIMMIVFGKDLFTAFDAFLSGITGNDFSNTSYYIATVYVLAHLIAGVLIARFANSISNEKLILPDIENKVQTLRQKKKNKKLPLIKSFFGVIWIILLITFLQSKIYPQNSWLSDDKVLRLLVRSFVIILSWIFLFNPLLNKVLKSWLEKKKNNNPDVAIILELIPETKKIIELSWLASAGKKGFSRLTLFLKYAIGSTVS